LRVNHCDRQKLPVGFRLTAAARVSGAECQLLPRADVQLCWKRLAAAADSRRWTQAC